MKPLAYITPIDILPGGHNTHIGVVIIIITIAPLTIVKEDLWPVGRFRVPA